MHMQCCMYTINIFLFHDISMTSKANFIIWIHFTCILYSCSYIVCNITEKYLQIPLIYKRKCVWIFIVMLHARCSDMFIRFKRTLWWYLSNSLLDIQISVKVIPAEILFRCITWKHLLHTVIFYARVWTVHLRISNAQNYSDLIWYRFDRFQN